LKNITTLSLFTAFAMLICGSTLSAETLKKTKRIKKTSLLKSAIGAGVAIYGIKKGVDYYKSTSSETEAESYEINHEDDTHVSGTQNKIEVTQEQKKDFQPHKVPKNPVAHKESVVRQVQVSENNVVKDSWDAFNGATPTDVIIIGNKQYPIIYNFQATDLLTSLVKAVIHYLAHKKYDQMCSDLVACDVSPREMAKVIDDYGETLDNENDEVLGRIKVDRFIYKEIVVDRVEFPLSTIESGVSDLVVKLEFIYRDGKIFDGYFRSIEAKEGYSR